MSEAINLVAGLLARCFEIDVWFYSQWWLYAFILPAAFYTVFFFIKWSVLTAPVWLPVTIIAKAFRSTNEPTP